MHCSLSSVDHRMHLSNFSFYFSIFFQKLKSSSTWLIAAFLCERSFFYFHVKSAFLSNLYLSTKCIVSIVVNVYYILSLCLIVKTLYWHYHEISMLQVEASAENLNLVLCWLSNFAEIILLCELLSLTNLLISCLQSIIHEKILLRR